MAFQPNPTVKKRPRPTIWSPYGLALRPGGTPPNVPGPPRSARGLPVSDTAREGTAIAVCLVRTPMRPLPQYASHVSRDRLVWILCRNTTCRRGSVLAELFESSLGDATGEFAGRAARCLKCGRVATDSYNWDRNEI
jgi:hypothetical protein